MTAALLALFLAAAPDAPLRAVTIEGDVTVELIVGGQRGVEVNGAGVELVGPRDGELLVSARARAAGRRPTVTVRVDARSLELVVRRGARLHGTGEAMSSLAVVVGQTSRVDVTALRVRNLTVTASEAARVRARGDNVTVRADRSAQVVLVGKPKKLTQDVRGAARVTVEP